MIPNELIWCLHAEESIAFVLLDIGSYRDRTLDETALEHLEQILGFFLEQQKDVILRPVYDREGKGKEREPENLSLVTGHLKQIAEALKRMPNSVFAVQGTLIGNWGEMPETIIPVYGRKFSATGSSGSSDTGFMENLLYRGRPGER